MGYLFLLLASALAMSAVLTPVATNNDYQSAPEYLAILDQLKPFGEFKGQAPEEKVVEKKTMSRGQQLVEEAKARNRAIIAEQNKKEKAQSESQSKMSELDKWKKEEKDTLNNWKKETRDQLAQWQKEQAIFLGRIKVYQENTFQIPVKKEVIVEKKVIPNLPDSYVVNASFKVPMRDQYFRPTCSAFAGIRSVEILLTQNNQNKDLSEQYFYWASKPKCQTSPCSEKGSWINFALEHSQNNPQIDIPTEESCRYEGSNLEQNETQIPLDSGCKKGVVKVAKFESVKTLADVIASIRKDTPVIMAAKLSENFFKNTGLVTLTDSTKSLGLEKSVHTQGHAFLGVGFIELPEKLKATEGQYCIIVANSWGKGWGAGGYSCLTEKWLLKFRQPSSFASVTQVSSL